MLRTAVNWMIGRALRLIPESLRGRLLPTRLRFSARDVPAPPVVPDTPVRLYIAPVNYAGQAWQWARAAETSLEGVGATVMVIRSDRDYRYPADYHVPFGVYAASTRWQRRQREHVISHYGHVMIEAEKQPFGAVLDETTEAQARRLRDAGVSVSMLCHGTDIRLPSRHLATEAYSPFSDSMAAVAPALERRATANRRLLDSLGAPVFVSTPDLLLDVPYARWLPVVVDVDSWLVDTRPLQRRIPIVAHAPSNGPVKGSDIIDPILQRLHEDGILVYRRIAGIPHEQMRAFYGEADIVLDQFRIGNYGVAAAEAMATGRLVVSHVNEHTRSAAASLSGLDVPIVEATIDDVEDVLRRIVASPDDYRLVAERGLPFVQRAHDGRMSADVLSSFLGVS